jgi:hypothetical protein
MASLLPRIHQDLFDFIDHDPDELGGLLEFWYLSNSEALSAALTAQTGVSLIVNVSSFQSFESLAKKLFLIADTLVLRDTRKWTQEELGYRAIPIPIKEYRPGYYEDLIDDLSKLRPSPLTLLHRPTLYWSSTTKKLNNGHEVSYAGWDYNSIPNEFVNWISTSGRNYMRTGQVVYAPFIPPLDWELEFLKNDINLPDYFNAAPTFHQKYDWLSTDHTKALLSLQFPFLDGLDIETISKVKEDHRDEFLTFSRTLLSSIGGIKSAFGSEGFLKEVKYIQRNQIDAGISDVEKTVRNIQARGTWQKGAILTGLVGIDIAVFLGVPVTTVVTGLAATGVAMIAAKIAQLKDQGDLKAKSPYFLWQLNQRAAGVK